MKRATVNNPIIIYAITYFLSQGKCREDRYNKTHSDGHTHTSYPNNCLENYGGRYPFAAGWVLCGNLEVNLGGLF
jgi:hypothetical protein